jgi:UTP--glucose-1-phosphate uridylyltransferase
MSGFIVSRSLPASALASAATYQVFCSGKLALFCDALSGPADPRTPEVIQIETAIGAAIEVFEDAQTIEVGRDRFIPVKTTNDLLVLRSDVYDLGQDFGLDQAADVPFVELDPDFYKLVGDFDQRFPEGAPSLRKASSLKVDGDFTFGRGVQVVGDVELESNAAQRIPADTVLDG